MRRNSCLNHTEFMFKSREIDVSLEPKSEKSSSIELCGVFMEETPLFE